MRPWDVVVVGAGPSGAVAAHALARGGASVLLLDRAAFPRWKVCGACLSPGSLQVLRAAGLGHVAAELGAVRLRRLVLQARKATSPVPLAGSVAVSRAALDHALVSEAVEAGAAFWPRARAALRAYDGQARRILVARDGAAGEVKARLVVDATGLGHGLRLASARPDRVAPSSRLGLGAVVPGAGYPVEPGDLHMAVSGEGYVGLVRVEDGSLNVAAAVDPEGLGAEDPEKRVSRILVAAGLPPILEEPIEGWRGTPLLTRSSADVGCERLIRIGDAAGYVEPFTGEGICWALSAGLFVARLAGAGVDSWSDGLLEEWRTFRARSLARSQRLCRLVAGGLRRPWVVGAGIAALGVAPGLAAPFVAWAARPPAEAGA